MRLWMIGAAALAGIVATAQVEATEQTAYARLLETHVRPAMVSGIRLNLVEYAALKADPNYPKALHTFATARPEALGSEAARIAFWVNAYNLLAIKTVVDRYPIKSIKDGGGFFTTIWKTKVGVVAGRERTLDEIEHEILRKEFREPRVHFAIVCASLSCPDLRPEPFVAERLDAQLDEATRAFLANPTKGLVVGADGERARVSTIFKWFADDFTGGVVEFIRAHLDASRTAALAGLTPGGLSYLDYDWSLNDAARAR